MASCMIEASVRVYKLDEECRGWNSKKSCCGVNEQRVKAEYITLERAHNRHKDIARWQINRRTLGEKLMSSFVELKCVLMRTQHCRALWRVYMRVLVVNVAQNDAFSTSLC